MEKKKQLFLIVFVAASLLNSCGVFYNRKLIKDLKTNPVEVYTYYDQALRTKKESLLVIVFADNDNAYFQPITQTLKIDSTNKDDVSIHNVLARDFAVVKLKYSAFADIMNQPEKYPRFESSDTTFMEMAANQSYIFITGKEKMYIYGLITTHADKATIHDRIWVKFGP